MQAKDLKPGWWFSLSDDVLQMASGSNSGGYVWVVKQHDHAPVIYPLLEVTEVTHHPDCTGWDWPIPKRVRLEVGKRYVMRNCKPTRPLYRSGDPEFVWEDGERSWTANGKCWNDSTVSDSDIVAEYVEPEPAIDPGDGWRLLEDEETVDTGVEFTRDGVTWKPCWMTMGETVQKAKQGDFIKAFRRRIAPVYVPFTQETFRPHRDRWIVLKSNRCVCRVVRVNKERVLVGSASIDWQQLFDEYEFEDGDVCGVKHG